MARAITFIAFLAVYAVLSSVSGQYVLESNYTETLIFNSTVTTDANFADNPLLTRTVEGTAIMLWGFYTSEDDTGATTLWASRKSLYTSNFSVIAQSDVEIASLDNTTSLVFSYSANGYVGAAFTSQTVSNTTTTNAVTLLTFKSSIQYSDPLPTQTVITTGELTYEVHEIFHHDDYFYIIYSATDSDGNRGIYLQGIAPTAPDYPKFNEPLAVNQSDMADELHIKCAKVPQVQLIYCIYRAVITNEDDNSTTNGVSFITVDLSAASTSETLIANDTDEIRYIPEDVIISSDDGYKDLLLVFSAINSTNYVTSIVGINDTAPAEPYELFALEDTYDNLTLAASTPYNSGFLLIASNIRATDGVTTKTLNVMKIYDWELVLISDADTFLKYAGIIQGIRLPNTSYHVLFSDSYEAPWDDGYLVMVKNQTNQVTFASLIEMRLSLVVLLLLCILL